MRGVCVDALNPLGRPSPLRLSRLGVSGVRLELRDHPDFYVYYDKLVRSGIGIALLIGPSTENLTCYSKLLDKPDMLIIGNEPDSVGHSSWTMTPEQYTALWDQWSWTVRDTQLCAAGMLHGTEYLQKVWPALHPKPDLVNFHYPDTEEQLSAFHQFKIPVIVGEWCWRTGTAKQILDWQTMLSKHTNHSFWFCWSDGMFKTMGLLDYRDVNKRKCYYSYQKALEAE